MKEDTQQPVATAAKRPAPPARSLWQRHENALLGLAAVLVFLTFWEVAVGLGWINPLFTSSPSRIAVTAVQMFADGGILYDLQVSGAEFVVGYGMAVLAGVPLGILMGWYRRL